MATVEKRQQKPEPRPGPPSGRPAPPRRIRVTIRRINPWSVLKFSLVFYFCLMLVIVIGLAILFMVVDALGVIDSFEDLLTSFGFGSEAGFEVNGGFLFRTLFLLGLISVAVWSALTVFLSFLYNLISDLVGGIDLTLSEKR